MTAAMCLFFYIFYKNSYGVTTCISKSVHDVCPQIMLSIRIMTNGIDGVLHVRLPPPRILKYFLM